MSKISGKCINNKIGVRFDSLHNRVLATGLNGLPILRVDKWTNEATKDEATSKLEENIDYKETHSQICVVTVENDKYPYRIGDKLFVHYMAWETADGGDIVTHNAVIIVDYVFFTILPDNSLKMAKDTYIGEPIFTDEEITPSGIFLQAGKKEALKVKILHVPEPYVNEYGHLIENVASIGDTVISIDQYNYEFNYNGKRYVRLTSKEIIGIYEEI